MKRISIPEYGRISHTSLGTKLLGRLRAFDTKHARTSGEHVLDWDHVNCVAATNYVGVIQVPGLVLEILPKVDSTRGPSPAPFEARGSRRFRAQQNLLYMLSFTQKLPILPRDLAGLRLQRMPLLEAVVLIFVRRLLEELRLGLDSSYVTREENVQFCRGKLLLTEQVRHNLAHQERHFVSYEEFVADTWLNRILKAACFRLLRFSRSNQIQRLLRVATLYFSEVADRRIDLHHFKLVHHNRNNERFRTLVDFAWMVLMESAPAPASGKLKTFSLLFPMEILFEQFVASFIRHHSHDLSLSRRNIFVQATRRRRWLLRTESGAGKFQLKPDILIEKAPSETEMILDTKWKHLKPDSEDSKNGVAQSDLYQLYAYAHRYASPDNVLLFPLIEGATPKTFCLAGDEDKRLRIEFLDLNRDLRRERLALLADMKRVLAR